MAPGTSHNTVQRSVLETDDFDEAYEFLRAAYTDHRLRSPRPPPGFRFRSRFAQADGLAVDVLTHGATLKVNADPFPHVMILLFRQGRYEVRTQHEEARFAAGDALLFPPGVAFDASWDRIKFALVRFPIAVAERVAARHGVKPADLRFDSMTPVSAALGRQWTTTSDYLARSFAGPDPMITHPLVRSATAEVAAATALAVFPNTTMTVDYLSGPGRVEPAAIRRAVAFIDTHADQPVTIDDIAAAAGVGVRALQAGFAHHRDTTPGGYLRRVRLERVHRELQAADATLGDTVGKIARRWGFGNLGRFAVDYRKTYGRSPSRTLRT
ncbi:AraC family transcriptional regulator [Actinoplanes solisilvae]|uniref:AraC family transcriptional regulator n=1 Tax=Actinoplanes solisilvae TaxID=2486853 RepID=UPI000FDAA724|nr:AraC family transcriptional regulator [Actinoplanes solisilvae]